MSCWRVPMMRGFLRPKRDPASHLLDYAAVPAGDKVYYFGGYYERDSYDMDQIEVSVFNTVTLRWMELMMLPPETIISGERHPVKVPSKRMGHTAVLIESIVYTWGGVVNCGTQIDYDYRTIGDCQDNIIYAFDVDTHGWLNMEISGSVPAARAGHSACVLGKAMYVYGGYEPIDYFYIWLLNGGYYTPTNDFYKLDTCTMVWSLINTRGTAPPASHGHSATIIGTKMFVFGGLGSDREFYNDVNVFDTETDCWLSTPSAQLPDEGRLCHSAFTYKRELYIFGGKTEETDDVWQFNDLWKLNPATFSWKKVEPKGKGHDWSGHDWSSGKWCCMVEDRIILFGGYRNSYGEYRNHEQPILQILDLSPTLKTLCKLEVIQHDLQQSGLPYNIRWELAAMTTPTESAVVCPHDFKHEDKGRKKWDTNWSSYDVV